MGLIEGIKKALLALLFLFLGGITYLTGFEFAADDRARGAPSFLFSMFDRESLRSSLIKAIETDASADHRLLVEDLAVLAPIDPLPYEAALASALARGDMTAADRFATRVLSLQPRSLAANLHLLNSYVNRADYDAVIDQVDRLQRLNSLNAELLCDALIGVFRAHGDWQPLLSYLEEKPDTGDLILTRLMDESISALEVETVLEFYPEIQSEYLLKLIKNKAYRQAYNAWLGFTELTNEARSLPFNGAFVSTFEPIPFNWSIDRRRAELQERGGLYVTYLGSGKKAIVSQILAAPAGEYTLVTEAKGRMPENGGNLEWRIQCVDTNEVLVLAPISLSRISEPEVFEHKLNVPELGCEFQNLELRGRAGEFPKTSTTEILSVRLWGEEA